MAKRLGSTYRPGTRTKEWRKVKNRQRAEVVIGGYTPGHGEPVVELRGAARRALDGRLAGVRRRRRHGLHAAPARRAGQAAAGAAHRGLPVRPAAPDGLPARRRPGSSRCCTATVEITEFTNEGYVRQASFIALNDPAQP